MAYELVTRDPLEVGVTLEQVQVGAADAGTGDLDQGLLGARLGIGQVIVVADPPFGYPETAQRYRLRCMSATS